MPSPQGKIEPRTVLTCTVCHGAHEACAGCGEPFHPGDGVACLAAGAIHVHAKPACRAKVCRRMDFKEDEDGAYVVVFQRPGEDPSLELAFFEGTRDLEQAERRLDLLRRAIEQARTWHRRN